MSFSVSHNFREGNACANKLIAYGIAHLIFTSGTPFPTSLQRTSLAKDNILQTIGSKALVWILVYVPGLFFVLVICIFNNLTVCQKLLIDFGVPI